MFKVVKLTTSHIISQGLTDSEVGCETAIDLTLHLPTLNSSLPTNHLPVNLTLSPSHKGS